MCEIDFKPYYTFKDSLCQSKYSKFDPESMQSLCNLSGSVLDYPCTEFSEPNYNAYKNGSCFPAKDSKFKIPLGKKKRAG